MNFLDAYSKTLVVPYWKVKETIKDQEINCWYLVSKENVTARKVALCFKKSIAKP